MKYIVNALLWLLFAAGFVAGTVVLWLALAWLAVVDGYVAGRGIVAPPPPQPVEDDE